MSRRFFPIFLLASSVHKYLLGMFAFSTWKFPDARVARRVSCCSKIRDFVNVTRQNLSHLMTVRKFSSGTEEFKYWMFALTNLCLDSGQLLNDRKWNRTLNLSMFVKPGHLKIFSVVPPPSTSFTSTLTISIPESFQIQKKPSLTKSEMKYCSILFTANHSGILPIR